MGDMKCLHLGDEPKMRYFVLGEKNVKKRKYFILGVKWKDDKKKEEKLSDGDSSIKKCEPKKYTEGIKQ